MSNLKDTYWPDMSRTEAAEEGIKRASHTAYVVAGVTSLLALLAWFDILHLTSPWSLVDAVLFAVIGLFISRQSRTAALLGLALYLLEGIDRIVSGTGGRILSGTGGGMGAFSVLALIFTLFFINGVRGAFSLVRLRRQSPLVTFGGPADASTPETR